MPQVIVKIDGTVLTFDMSPTSLHPIPRPLMDSVMLVVPFNVEGVRFHQRILPESHYNSIYLPIVGNASKVKKQNEDFVSAQSYEHASNIEEIQHGQWKRILLLVIAITVHNIPEGLAVGVGFGAIGSSLSATFESARLVCAISFYCLENLYEIQNS